ncbi:hypothetical protein K488DRAFT_90897 [Vararia minispora EC-137]|uniref:Uncharacterized protein n=1 Tax=Vararia minispora EC-137 TaxID=1314806 RepID=A0ACB8Q6W7_9AGAM|nr:hypothetical protein K488DRAFT_90897 [Vararia minispora EC-137]
MIPEAKRRALARRCQRASRLVRLIVFPHPDFTIPRSPPDPRSALIFSTTSSLFRDHAGFSRSVSWQSAERSSLGTARSRRFLSPDDAWERQTPRRTPTLNDPHRTKYGALALDRTGPPPSPSPSPAGRRNATRSAANVQPAARIRTLSEPTMTSPSPVKDKPRSVSQPVPACAAHGLGPPPPAKLLTPILEDAPEFSAMYPSFASSLNALRTTTSSPPPAQAKHIQAPFDASLTSDDAVENMSSHIGSLPSVVLTAASPVLNEASKDELELADPTRIFDPSMQYHQRPPSAGNQRRASMDANRSRRASDDSRQRRRRRSSTEMCQRRTSSESFRALGLDSFGGFMPCLDCETPPAPSSRSLHAYSPGWCVEAGRTAYHTPVSRMVGTLTPPRRAVNSPGRHVASDGSSIRRTAGQVPLSFSALSSPARLQDCPTRQQDSPALSLRSLYSYMLHPLSSPERTPARRASSPAASPKPQPPSQTHTRRASVESVLSAPDTTALTHAVLGLLDGADRLRTPQKATCTSVPRTPDGSRSVVCAPRTPDWSGPPLRTSDQPVYPPRTPDRAVRPFHTPDQSAPAPRTPVRGPRLKISTPALAAAVAPPDATSPTSDETAVELRRAWVGRVVERIARAVRGRGKDVKAAREDEVARQDKVGGILRRRAFSRIARRVVST